MGILFHIALTPFKIHKETTFISYLSCVFRLVIFKVQINRTTYTLAGNSAHFSYVGKAATPLVAAEHVCERFSVIESDSWQRALSICLLYTCCIYSTEIPLLRRGGGRSWSKTNLKRFPQVQKL